MSFCSQNLERVDTQAPAALRALAALARPLLLRRQHWTADESSDAFLREERAAWRCAFFDGEAPCNSQEGLLRADAVDAALARSPPLAYAVGPLLTAALACVDSSDCVKTRTALLWFDNVLRWVPARDDDDEEPARRGGSASEDEDLEDPERGSSLSQVALQVGEWAPLFLERLLATVEHRDDAAKVPNHSGSAQGETVRYVGAIASARDAASAELLRCVCGRLFARLAPDALRRSVRLVSSWALGTAPPRFESSKDAASLVACCVAAEPQLKPRGCEGSSGAAKELVDSLEREYATKGVSDRFGLYFLE